MYVSSQINALNDELAKTFDRVGSEIHMQQLIQLSEDLVREALKFNKETIKNIKSEVALLEIDYNVFRDKVRRFLLNCY